MEDQMSWPEARDAMDNWPEPRVQFDADDPEKTISLGMAQWMLQKQYRANPGAFANKAADAFKACVFKNGSEDKNGA